ncbi:hypothetical protein MYOV003v1_p0126 [Vibrio phage 207E48.1]|nr:hypothetical protein MYOV003v1_p0126 [Vibrio phage 207E48.1]
MAGIDSLNAAVAEIEKATIVVNRTTKFIEDVAFGNENTIVPDPMGGSNSSPTIRKLIKDSLAGALAGALSDLVDRVDTLNNTVTELGTRIDNLKVDASLVTFDPTNTGN